MIDADLIERFRAVVGPAHALTAPEDKAPFLKEWRDKYFGTSDLVLLPHSTEEVAAILKIANESGTAIVPQGGGTGLVGGQVPDGSGDQVVVCLKRMNRVRLLDEAGFSMVVEAGVTLKDAQSEAEAVDRLFPLSIASEGSAEIGGVIATNAGGVAVLKYGMMRELLLGLEVVLASGEVWHGLSGLRKDNTGYDFKGLFAGSEGTLGIITAARLKLFPLPAVRQAAFVGFSSLEDVAAFFALSTALAGPDLGAFELLSERGLAFSGQFLKAQGRPVAAPLKGAYPWYVLLELEGEEPGRLQTALERLLQAGIESGPVQDAVVSSSEKQRLSLWEIREVLSEAQKLEGGSIKHDISVPVAALPLFLKEADELVEKMIPGARPVPFGHFGDGNIHYNVSQPVGVGAADFLAEWERLNEAIYALVLQHHGSISAEHGIGVMKRELLARVKDPAALFMMRAIKGALDPKGILNPGKVI